jgi:RNA 2',3'-cyclic 3'-phosphodiesterase
MLQPLRVFIAVPIPRGLAFFLKNIQAQLQSPGMDVRWLMTKNIHLTLKFLGDIERTRVPAVTARMDAAAGQMPSFRLNARGVGVFPNRRHARVLWVGLDGELDRLGEIHSALESSLESIGFNRETRRFHPHLTIGRTRRRIDARTIGASLDPLNDATSDSFPVDCLRLFQSNLKPAGVEYSLLHTSQLAVE